MRLVGGAHHEAFAATDGEDPDWPLWYADYLRENASSALNADLSREELAELLVAAERSADSAEDWPELYVDYILDNGM